MQAHFQSVEWTLITLFRVSTGDAWGDVMGGLQVSCIECVLSVPLRGLQHVNHAMLQSACRCHVNQASLRHFWHAVRAHTSSHANARGIRRNHLKRNPEMHRGS